ncbi:potassium channel family protein [Streptomyces gobitricini]|uniref:Potassium channel domain-containing protein n=1 Tax=Streptomyces gobitricini TaxID=68211 RepID=A0ABP5ZLQ8_9ACTN
MDWSISVIGLGLVLVALRDLFHTLWHPAGRGGLSTLVMNALWRSSRRRTTPGRIAAVVGPAAMVSVILTWTSIVIAGWTLIYWAHMPDGFAYSPGLDPAQRTDLLDALYLSLVALATLGFGDIVPVAGWLRVAVPIQALIGFALLTAAVSWVGQIYPALTRRRVLALRLASLRAAREATGSKDEAFAAVLLESLAVEIIHVRTDLSQHAETYYFHDGEDSTSLAAMISYAADLAVEGQLSQRADVRTSAAMLANALEGLATVLDRQFLKTKGHTEEIFAAYARDHGHVPVRA